VKRVTSSDPGTVEDPENSGSSTDGDSTDGGGTQPGGNTGGTTTEPSEDGDGD
jgi:hypothetical protein